jgi:predicted  nucleic acid-binding Zn-ribbon protein
MLSASKSQQDLLLEVSKLDLAISRNQTELENLEKNDQLVALRGQLLETSESLLQAHAKQEDIENEIRKIAGDLEMVEARTKHDQERAKQVASEREQKAVSQELTSLAARKSALEDAELQLLEDLEGAGESVKTLTQTRANLNLELEVELSKQHGSTLTLSAQVSELSEKREAAFNQLETELQSVYTRKAQRGIAVAQTLGRDCSACRLSINAVEFEAIMAQPAEQLPTCPNCDALIIR